MKRTITTKLIAIILVLATLTFSMLGLTACKDTTNDTPPTVDGPGTNPNPNPNPDPEPQPPVIVVPPYKEYARDTVNFKDITYTRPDIEGSCEAFEMLAEKVRANEDSFEALIEMIEAEEERYTHIRSMYSYLQIMTSIDSSDEYWAAEEEYVSTKYPEYVKYVEDLFVAAANSPHAERFEDEYFGEGLIEEYRDGGSYTDELVALMATEAELEAQYSQLSTKNVTITIAGKTDTVDNFLAYYKETYGENSTKYKNAAARCQSLFEAACTELSRPIFVELFKTRKLIADAFGDESYLTYAYDTIYHDYSEEEMLAFIQDVPKYILPVYTKLSDYIFNDFVTGTPKKLDSITLINDTYDILKNKSETLSDIFAYMLQYNLYDIQPAKNNRYEGAFSIYIDSNESPFVFISTSETTSDYMTLFHEFGHFADSYINNDSYTSLDLSEVSSQTLSLLALTILEDRLDNLAYKYILYNELDNSFLTLIYQCFYALFEHKAYALDYEDITEENLSLAVQEAAKEMGLNWTMINDISMVFIPHLFLYPFYVQSYATSLTASLEIYMLELEQEGKGFEVYLNLLDRGDEMLTFEEYLSNAGVKSPFRENALKDLANKIHYQVLGSYYFKDATDSGNAA